LRNCQSTASIRISCSASLGDSEQRLQCIRLRYPLRTRRTTCYACKQGGAAGAVKLLLRPSAGIDYGTTEQFTSIRGKQFPVRPRILLVIEPATMDCVGLRCPMIKEPISLEQVAPGRFNRLLSDRKPGRLPDEICARPEDLSRQTSTAVLLPFPTARAKRGRRGTTRDVGHAYPGTCASQLRGDIVRQRTISLAVSDCVAGAFVLASVAFGPVLVWFLLWMAH
jgi:hypothetical protein